MVHLSVRLCNAARIYLREHPAHLIDRKDPTATKVQKQE
jgi:hypothetical protein